MNITAQRLRKLREQKGLSQREVAESIGMTRTAYNKYERGSSRPVRKLDELSKLFEVSIDYLLGRDATNFERELTDIAPADHAQIQKYLGLSEEGKLMVNLTLNAVHEWDKKRTTDGSKEFSTVHQIE